jgi:hypothetical protein
MDDQFFKERAIQIRNLAGKADPFTKRRLIELAVRYERRVASRMTLTLPPKSSSPSTGVSDDKAPHQSKRPTP